MRGLLLAALWMAALAAAAAPGIAIVNARLVDGTAPVSGDGITILVEGTEIAHVARGGEVPAGARVVDAAGRTVLPGFIDLHAHLLSGGFDTVSDRSASYDPADQRRALRQMLYWGVTSAAFSVQPLEAGIALREALARGEITGPRLFVSGPALTAPGGWGGTGDPEARIELTTPDEARNAVRRLAAAGVDFLKTFYDDMGTAFVEPLPQMRRDVLAALVEEAHRNGLKVAVHAYTVENHKAALAAGADILYHSAIDRPVDGEYLALARKARPVYAATLSIYRDTFDPAAVEKLTQTTAVRVSVPERTLATLGPDGPLREFAASTRSREIVALQPTIAKNLRRIFKAGVPLVTGPDTGVPGVFPGLSVHREMALMAEAGVPPAAVIAAATRNGAAALGRQDRIGTIAPGQVADLVIVDGDPVRDIRNTQRIHAVIQGGRFVNREALLELPGNTRQEAAMTAPQAEPRVVSLTEDDFGREIIPGVAHMKHFFGSDVSVALFKIEKGKGTSFPTTPHSHGEEVAVQLKGTAIVRANGKEYRIRAGEAIIMPPGLEHAGFFTDDEEAWLLAICTPPRKDYGPATW